MDTAGRRSADNSVAMQMAAMGRKRVGMFELRGMDGTADVGAVRV
jgi:hypothetical protein